MEAGNSRLVVCAAIGAASGVAAMAAALAVSAGRGRAGGADSGVSLIDLRSSARPLRGAVLASSQARSIESLCREHPGLRPAARGRVCFLTAAGEPSGPERAELLDDLLSPGLGIGLVVAVCDPSDFRELIAAETTPRRSVLLKATRGSDRPLIALLAAELRAEGIPVKVWVPAIGPVGARRALAGLDPGGETARRAGRFASALFAIRGAGRQPAGAVRLRAEGAQALPAVLGIAILTVALALILVAIGGAATAKGRLQRAADLAAISAARSMRDDFDRLFLPARLPGGAPDPAHLERAEYLARARAAAMSAAERNDLDGDLVEVGFPDRRSFAPLRVRVEAGGEIEIGGAAGPPTAPDRDTSADAKAEVTLAAATGSDQPAMAEGGGYAGPLAYRQGEPMRPDVAIAFDRLAAAARGAGVALVINSAYRSDAEQQRLWDANPDPRWVAPPGTSLHRCGTELDLGPSPAYGWLAANASRYGFTQRYAWEAWHFGFVDGPEPCSAEGDRVAASGAKADGAAAGGQGLPGFVPARYRAPLLAAAARHDVSAALLAAQLMAESNFNPNAVSAAGAQGIAQFMPATAASYGLDDPFDAIASIEAQARMMGGLLKQFGSVELALAAYNAGPGAVAACDCVPPYPETQAYVARILALLDGAGALAAPIPVLEVRLID
jgi:hypothetical protein